MKKLILNFAFTVFCLTLPLLMAQTSAQAQDSEDSVSVSVSAESSIDENEDGKRRIVIDVDDDEARDRVERVVEKLGRVFGENFSSELEIELNSMSERDREELEDALEDVFGDNGVHFDTNGMGAGETFVAITALSLTLGLPVIILILVLLFGQRKRRQMMDLAAMYIKADQPMPEHVMSEFGSGKSGNQRLRSGLQYTFVGIAVVAILGTLADGGAATLGLIPIAIGLARLIYWKFDKAKSENELTRDDSLAQ